MTTVSLCGVSRLSCTRAPQEASRSPLPPRCRVGALLAARLPHTHVFLVARATNRHGIDRQLAGEGWLTIKLKAGGGESRRRERRWRQKTGRVCRPANDHLGGFILLTKHIVWLALYDVGWGSNREIVKTSVAWCRLCNRPTRRCRVGCFVGQHQFLNNGDHAISILHATRATRGERNVKSLG